VVPVPGDHLFVHGDVKRLVAAGLARNASSSRSREAAAVEIVTGLITDRSTAISA
jgi:hypothetical protein